MPDTYGPAPLDPQAVRASLTGSGRMLPAAAYTDAAVLDWERRVFFGGGWVCVGRAALVGQARQRHAVRVAGDAVLLVRGDDGELRGFFNTCRHRGHELQACGTTATARFITCPYHSWVYELDGRLHRVPNAYRDAVDGEWSLVAARVAQWQGFVMVNVDEQAPPLARYLAGLDAILAPYELERLVVAASHTYELAANWKLAMENYQECYHCSTIHPELCRVSPPDSGGNYDAGGLWIGGTMDLADGAQTMSLDGTSGTRPLPGVTGSLLREVQYLQVFPNLFISAHPDYVMVHLLEPVAPHRTRVTCQWLFAPQIVAEPGFDPSYAVDFWDLTNRQDWSACEAVQRGVSSRGYRPGPLSPQDEPTTFQAIALVARSYLDGRLPPSAAAALPGALPGPRRSR